MNQIVDSHSVLFVTLDTLRFDVAQRAFEEQRLPNFSRWLPSTGWERRHTPANFTYAAHHAFFAGFLPTPIQPGNHPRLFATEFIGSETTTEKTLQFRQSNIVEGFRERGYQTDCIGGVGFFNKQNALGRVLPGMFENSYWSDQLGVTCPQSTNQQVELALDILRKSAPGQLHFLFVNVSALHQPNCCYLPGAQVDTADSQLAALVYVDDAMEPLFDQLEKTGRWFVIVCSDHGTCYGEDGYVGHRVNHAVVGEVPYANFVIDQESNANLASA